MFRATRSSDAYTSHRAGAAFYAQSWVLVHYITLAGGEDTKKVNQMIAPLDRGRSADDSIRLVFGSDFAAFEERFKKYALSQKLSSMRYDAPSLPDLRERISELEEKRDTTELVLFGLRTRREGDVDVRNLAAALANDPANLRAAAANALVARSGAE